MGIFSLAPSRAKCGAAAAIASLVLMSTAVGAKEHYYRDSVDTMTAPPARYTVEVPKRATAAGGFSVVDKDRRGRIVSVTFQQDGVRQSKRVYEYSGAAQWPSGYTTYDKDGVGTGKVTIRRDSEGRTIEFQYFTAQGGTTGRVTNSYSDNRADESVFAADGSLKQTDEEYFDGSGAEIRNVEHISGGGRAVDTSYDPQRGVVLSEAVSDNGTLSITQKYTYNANDDLIRVDLYDDKGQWYGDNIYAQNLETEKHYKFSDGTTEDVIMAYDRRRWHSSGRESINGTLVCTFQHDLLPDGTVKRTLVLGPDGTLLEEFPNNYVSEVNQDGSAPAGYPRSVYKQGNLW